MVMAINQIGHTMNIKTIAEFVEDQKTLDAVRKVGVDYAQGYFIAKPAPIEIALNREPVDFCAKEDLQDIVELKSVSAES
jgi:EAL domain-containing protein (putative c-di-GMP-specific phosphodiesterase class I)